MTKRFPGVLALADVSLRVAAGETVAVIGENGAGKSTLMKTLAGIEIPDAGEIRLNGSAVHFRQPADAIAAGISLIHQELNLHEHLSVAENIFLGREPNRFGWIDRASMHGEVRKFLQRVGLDVAPETPLAGLSTAGRQLVEIAKALSTDASVVIMDEPTSSLTTRETEQLFELVDSLRDSGVSVIYISHRLGEVARLAGRVEVMRDGRNAGTLTGTEIDHDRMVAAMVGRDIARLFDRRPHPPGDASLSVSGLKVESDGAPPVDLAVRRGEIVGIAGLVGSGRSELLETIFGVRDRAGGTVTVGGQPVPPENPRAAILAGLGLVPEDRKQTGLLVESSVRENATLATLIDAPAAPWVDWKWVASATAALIARLKVKTASSATRMVNLSGGNQQKVAVGKWLMREPVALMLDEPTRGVDVGGKEEIYALLDRLAGQGLAILFVSSEMEEVLALADRVLVMHEGRIAGELGRDELSEEAIMRLAVGIAPAAA